MDWRLYTALFYLKKGNFEAFYDLLLIKNYKTKTIILEKEKDLYYLHKENYINFKDKEIIILTKKTENLLSKKNNLEEKKEELIDNEFIKNFLKGFPPNRYGVKEELKKELENFIKKYEYSKEIIIEAKEQYLQDESNKNYLYVLLSTNFIKKKLESYCRFISIKKENESNIVTTNGNFMI